jgi:hypothetical protein
MPTFTEMQERLSAGSRWDFSDLSAVYINCTPKRSPENSHTQGLADRSIAIMEQKGVSVEVVRAVDHEIATDQVAGEGAGVVAASGLSDRPMPRWSTAMISKSRASAGISRRQAYQNSGQPCTSSSGGRSPPVTACRRSSPVSMYRLVNVPVNPAEVRRAGDRAGAFRGRQWGGG